MKTHAHLQHSPVFPPHRTCVHPSQKPPNADRLPTIPPLPFRRGEGRGEGSVRSLRPRVPGRERRLGSPRPGQRAYLLIEALVYIAVIVALLGAGYAAMYRCVDSSLALRRNADDITSALHAGERWRADVRFATSPPRVENTDAGQLLYLNGARGPIVYHFTTNAIFRRLDTGSWVRLLANAKSSTMTPDPRQHVTAWRWELELQTRTQGSVKPGRVRPLFTFIAVPQGTSAK